MLEKFVNIKTNLQGYSKTYSINIGVWVLGLSMLSEDARGNIVDLANQLEHGVLGELLESELALGHVAGIGFPQDSMTVSGNDTAGFQGVPQVFLDGLVAKIITNFFLHFGKPVKNFLVGQSVERTSETVQTSREG